MNFKNKKSVSLIILTNVLLTFVLFSAFAADSTPTLRELQEQQKILNRKIELLTENAKTEGGALSVGKEGFTIKSKDDQFKLKLRGLIQLDGRFYLDTPANLNQGTDTFVARRVRPILEGTVFDRFDFRFVPDFGLGTTVIQDAYLDIRFLPELILRGGKFKVPVGLERLQSDAAISFVELGLPSNLVPNRDLGVQVHGSIQKGVLDYALGVFNGVADGASGDLDINDGKDIAGRLFVRPFQNTALTILKKLGFGVGASYGKQEGNNNSATATTGVSTFKTPGQQTFFRYITDTTTLGNTVFAKGKLVRVSPQLRYDYRQLGVYGEYVYTSEEVATDATQKTLNHQAWQAGATFVLTGEDASYKGVSPKKPFNPTKGQWGAVEVAARYNEFRVDKDSFPTFASPTASAERARSFGGAVNWYLNDNVKLVANYEHTLFGGGAPGVNADRRPEKALFTRLQLNF